MHDSARKTLSAEQLRAISIVFGVVGRLFWEDPEAGVVDNLARTRALLAEEPFASACPGARELGNVLDGYATAADPQATMSQFRQDRAFLFYQVSFSRTSPYESVYRTDDRTLFGPTTLQVKHDYERHGLSLATGRNEPCDHFGLECLYVSKVAEAGAAASEQGQTQSDNGGNLDEPSGDVIRQGATAELRAFLSEHLLVFAPIYLGNVERQAKSELYRAAAQVAREALSWAADFAGAAAVETLDPADFPVKKEPRQER